MNLQTMQPAQPQTPTAGVPIPITREAFQAKFGVTPPLQDTSTTPIPITREQFQAKFGVAPQLPETGFGGGIPWSSNPVSQYGSQVKDAFNAGIDQIKQGADEYKNSGANPLKMLEGGLTGASGVVSALTSPIAPAFKPIGAAIDATGNAIGDISAVQKFANSPAGEVTSRIAGDIANASNVAQGVAGIEGEKTGEFDLKGKTPPGENLLPKDKVTLPSGATTDAVTAQGLSKVADEWKSPVNSNTPGFKIPSGILEKSPDVPSFLAEQGLNPFEHIDDNGRYSTLDTADHLRQTAGADSNANMRTALKVADYGTEKTPVNELQTGAQKYASNGQNVTASDLESVGKNIADEVTSLENKYPKGMSLEQMHDERITYGKNGKFSPVGDKNVTNSARSNRAMADSLSNMIEAKAPKEIGYQGYNKYISNFYKAADYLDSLNGKRAPVSFKTSLIRTASKIGMAKVFETLPGGGIINSFMGYRIGKIVENALENMSKGQRNIFLKDLKVSDPVSYEKVKSFLENTTKEGNARLKLPAPKEKGTSPNPHIMSTSEIQTADKQTSAEMIKAKYNYNPVDKKYYKKGEMGGNPAKPNPNVNDKVFEKKK